MNPTSTEADLEQHYQTHLKHIKLKGLQPKTIDAYSRNQAGGVNIKWNASVALVDASATPPQPSNAANPQTGCTPIANNSDDATGSPRQSAKNTSQIAL